MAIVSKLDAKFDGVIFKMKDGSIVPPDEYVVFLAKDNAFALHALPEYLAACKVIGCDAEQITAVERLIDRVYLWRLDNQHRLKKPDAKNEKLIG